MASRIRARKVVGHSEVQEWSGLDGNVCVGLLVLLLVSQSASRDDQLAEDKCESGGDGVTDCRGDLLWDVGRRWSLCWEREFVGLDGNRLTL